MRDHPFKIWKQFPNTIDWSILTYLVMDGLFWTHNNKSKLTKKSDIYGSRTTALHSPQLMGAPISFEFQYLFLYCYSCKCY